jgi:uncharacterized protein
VAAPLILLWAALGRPAAWAGEVPFGEGLLWRVQVADAAPDAAPSYLLGTIHITDERVLALPAPVREAFDSARSATFEIIMTPDVRTQMSRAMVLTDGRTLDAMLGPEAFAKVAELGGRYGLEAGQLRVLKPWALSSIFSIPDSEMARTRGGALPLDQALQAEAARQGKAVHALETAAEQIALFNDMPEANQVAMLNAAVEQNAMIEDIFAEMTRQYLARDTGGIYTRMQAQREEQPELMELFLRRFNDDRNVTMVERMAERLAEGGAFIAIGALHFPGEKGLLSLLTQKGYSVERVY